MRPEPFSRCKARKCSLGCLPTPSGLACDRGQPSARMPAPRPPVSSAARQRRGAGGGSRTHSHGSGRVRSRAFPVKGTEPLAAGPVNASCFLCLNVPLPMTVSVDLSEKHPNVFTEEAVGPRSMRLLFRGGKGRRRTAELVVFRSRGFSTRPCCARDCRLPELLWAPRGFLLVNTEGAASDRSSTGLGAVCSTRRITNFNLHTFSLVEETFAHGFTVVTPRHRWTQRVPAPPEPRSAE